MSEWMFEHASVITVGGIHVVEYKLIFGGVWIYIILDHAHFKIIKIVYFIM